MRFTIYIYIRNLARNKYAYFKRLFNFEDDRDSIRGPPRIEESEGAFRVLFDAHELTEFQDRKLRQLKPLRDCSQRDRIFL